MKLTFQKTNEFKMLPNDRIKAKKERISTKKTN